jgi:hypothetical protein
VFPVLKRAAPLWWRDPSTAQFGTDPEAAVVAGLSSPLRGLLDLLDGTRSVSDVVATAAARGVPPGETARLLEVLADAGALDDGALEDPLRRLDARERRRLSVEWSALATRTSVPGAAATALLRRQRAAVIVTGDARLATVLAALLAAAGVSTVDPRVDGSVDAGDALPGGLRPADVGRDARGAACDAVVAAGPRAATTAVAPALAVVAGDPPPHQPPVDAAGLPVPHLAVAATARVGVVGPLVVPGRAPCLRCVELIRRDRDPQLSAARAAGACDAPGDTALTVTTAGLAALHALAFLDGEEPLAPGVALELRAPDWRLRRRTWPASPECECAGQ